MMVTTVGFGTLREAQLCIVIDTGELSLSKADELAQALMAKTLECLRASNGNEYAKSFNLEQGIIVYSKKHAPSDSDHTKGKHLGVTIKEAFEIVKEACGKEMQIAPDALEKLEAFLKRFDALGMAPHEVMPELESIEDLATQLKKPSPAKKEGGSLKGVIQLLLAIGLAFIVGQFFMQRGASFFNQRAS